MRPANDLPETKGHHEYQGRTGGYAPAEYVPQEYPKVVAYEQDGVTPITAKDAEDEIRLKEIYGLPSAADLDAVADEQKAADATA